MLLLLLIAAKGGLAQSRTAGAGLINAPNPQNAEGMAQAGVPQGRGSVEGIVVDPEGNACAAARVTLRTGSGTREAETDSGGRFAFAGVDPGPFTATIRAEGFAEAKISGFVHAGERYEALTTTLRVASRTEVRVTASQQEIATEQFHFEEKQRIFGAIPNFYVAYAPDAPPLTAREKVSLGWKTTLDPVTFALAGIVAGVEQANGSFKGYGEGATGYGKRFGASYGDMFFGTMIGGVILPALLKQDPRYFYRGKGSTRSRLLYALATAVIAKGDNGRWQPNYSGIAGGLAAGAISNLYYPASDRSGAAVTFENAAIGTAGSAVQNVLQEFVVRKLTPRLPGYGRTNPQNP